MNICYYVTSHGFGHGVRTGAICNQLSPSVNLWIASALPEQFFREELCRPFTFRNAGFDCGCIQHDGVTINVEATAKMYTAIASKNRGLLDSEAHWLTENHIDGIVADITPFAFDAAAKAGIPSIAVTNFTWHDIYKEYLDAFPRFDIVVDEIKQQYSRASMLLALDPPMPMTYFPRRLVMPVTGRNGNNVRKEISQALSIDARKKIGLIYTGNFGLDRGDWHKLPQFAHWEFVGVCPLPGNPANYHLVSKKEFRYQDLTASVDCVISKIGYGTYSESVIHGVPIIYLPRADFAEFPWLEAGIQKWGHGYRIEEDAFLRLEWQEQLDTVARTVRPGKYAENGALRCAEEIERLICSPPMPAAT